MALRVAEATLERGGAFVAKVFMGGDFPALKKELADAVRRRCRWSARRRRASRRYEVYVLGKGYRGAKIR